MNDPEFITVTAPPGKVTPVHKDDGREPGGGQLRVTADVVVRVRLRDSHTMRRSIARGDLIPCNMDGAQVASAHLAAAPDELPGGRLTLKPFQRPLSPVTKSDLDAVVDLMTKEQT